MKFEYYRHENYQQVCDFLVELNREHESHINWNWARWEWMYGHIDTDKSLLPTIGLWKDEDKVVAAAIFDMYYGEAFCGALDNKMLPEVLDFAWDKLRDEGGLGVAVNDADTATQEEMAKAGFHRAEQTETLLCKKLDDLSHSIPEGFTVHEIRLPEDELLYKTVIWKGFDHQDDPAELQRMLENQTETPPHLEPELCLALVDENGEFAAHCGCWYDRRTDYAYVEPLCTIPKYRGKGLGKAVLYECLQRCKNLGAKKAFVISDQDFYKKLGFENHSHYTFWWKE